MTAALALDFAPEAVAINSTAPRIIVLTRMNAHAGKELVYRAELAANFRWELEGRPDGSPISSPNCSLADYITGTTVMIGGALPLTVAQAA